MAPSHWVIIGCLLGAYWENTLAFPYLTCTNDRRQRSPEPVFEPPDLPLFPMAKAKLNGAFESLTGTVDGWVYRRVRGHTVVASTPEPTTHPPSRALRHVRIRFAAAQAYAKQVLSDPCQREAYDHLAKALNRRADKIIAGDFLNRPVVHRIDVTQYRGRAGDSVAVIATDDVEVVSVEVLLTTPAGTVLERGPATKTHGVWRYAATINIPPGERITITATARDRPGHDGRATLDYP